MTASIKTAAVAITALCLVAVGAMILSDQASALSSKAPDTSSGGGYGTSNSRFVLERTGQNTVTSIQVPVYLPNKPTKAVSMTAVDFFYPWASRGNKPKVSFQGGSYVSSTKDFTIPASSFVEDSTTGYWKAFATAELANVALNTYNVAEFRLRVNVAGGLIGIGANKRYSTIPQNYYTPNSGDTYNYRIPFATPCNVSSNTTNRIKLDDLDSKTVDNLYNTITVKAYDETDGKYVALTQTSGSSMQNDYSANMVFKPGHKYRLEIGRVHANNTLMYTFPYDNIAYKVGCAWSLLGINSQNRVQVGGKGNFSSYGNYRSGSPRTVRPGDNVQFQHEVKNSGNMKTSSFSRWRERSGWQGTSGWSQSGGTFQSTLNALGSARWPADPTTYRIQPSDYGRTLCERYGVRGQSSSSNSTHLSAASCVRVTANWNITGTTKANKTTAVVGESITWTHELRNAGPDTTHLAITSKVGRTGFASNPDSNSISTSAGRAPGVIRSPFTTSYVAKASDVGKTVCQYIKWNPRSSSNSTENRAKSVCVTIRAAWDLTVSSTNSNQSAAPGVYGAYPYAAPRQVDAGDGIIFRHTAKNEGVRTSAGFDRWAGRSRFANTSATWVLFGTRTSGNTINAGATRTWNSPSYTARADTMGRVLCERHSVQGRSSESSASRSSVGSCITVRENYKLAPEISVGSSTAAPGTKVSGISGSADNRMDIPVKTTATKDPVAWQIVSFVLVKKPGVPIAIPTAGVGNGTPCSFATGKGGTRCSSISSGSNRFNINNNPLGSTINDVEVPSDLNLGDRICFMAAVKPHSSASSKLEWAYSDSKCVTIGKRPTVQVWGGDVRVKGSIGTGRSTGVKAPNPQTFTYGSWGEYGVMSRAANSDMSSGSGLANGRDMNGLAKRYDYHRLTASNVVAPYGMFNFANSTALANQFKAGAAQAVPELPVRPNTIGSGDYRHTGNLTIAGGEIPAGRSIVMYVTGSVTITGDITYRDTSYTSTASLPQLVIIADNIYIQKSVKNVDAWLLATGAIDTCSNEGTPGVMPTSGNLLRQGVCGEHLLVNGPVATNRLVLKRTAGALPGPDRDKAAETFNLRADAYLWLHNRSSAGAQAWTTGQGELPVRY